MQVDRDATSLASHSRSAKRRLIAATRETSSSQHDKCCAVRHQIKHANGNALQFTNDLMTQLQTGMTVVSELNKDLQQTKFLVLSELKSATDDVNDPA